MKSFLKKLQSFTNTTRSEFLFVVVLLTGLCVGAAVRLFQLPTAQTQYNQTLRTELEHLVDSLAQAEETTFSGTTPDGMPVPELAAMDTVVKKESLFPQAAKSKKITSGTVNINTASKQELMALPGVGEVTAENIIAFRAEQKFRRTEDLMQVRGIGVKKFQAMRGFLNVK